MVDRKQPARIVIEGFVCPSCEATSYEALTVSTPFNSQLETGVYRCAECNFGFLNPQRYVKQPRNPG